MARCDWVWLTICSVTVPRPFFDFALRSSPHDIGLPPLAGNSRLDTVLLLLLSLLLLPLLLLLLLLLLLSLLLLPLAQKFRMIVGPGDPEGAPVST